MALSEEQIFEELKNVIDPEMFVNIVDLGLVYGVQIEEGKDGQKKIKLEITMTSPMCPAGPELVGSCKRVLACMDEVGEVEVKVVLDPPWSPDLMTEDARDQLGIF